MDLTFIIESIIKLLASVACGFLMGLERKSRTQVIGMRTLILICVSSCLLSLLSVYMAIPAEGNPGGDSTRIAAGVVSGIGFLGAGAIIKQGLNIKGLTSAAIIWTASAFGMALGAGLYIQTGVSLILVLILLLGLENLEAKWFPAEKAKSIKLRYENKRVDTSKIRKIIDSYALVVSDLNAGHVIVGQAKERQIELEYLVKAPSEFDFFPLIEELKTAGNLISFSISD